LDPNAESEEVLELANGCLCCSIKDSGVAAIEKLMQKKGAFDYILLETTGLADPGKSCHVSEPANTHAICRPYCFSVLAE
jgi:G3E family GTPase